MARSTSTLSSRASAAASAARAEFAAQFALLSQTVANALAQSDTPERVDEQLSSVELIANATAFGTGGNRPTASALAASLSALMNNVAALALFRANCWFVFLAFAVAGVFYAALMALLQVNLRRLLAFAVVSHTSILVIGMFSLGKQIGGGLGIVDGHADLIGGVGGV